MHTKFKRNERCGVKWKRETESEETEFSRLNRYMSNQVCEKVVAQMSRNVLQYNIVPDSPSLTTTFHFTFLLFFNVPWNRVKGMKLVAKVYGEEGSTNNMPCSFYTSFFVFNCSKVTTIDFDGFMFSWNCLLYQCTLFNFLLPWLYCLGMPAPPSLWAAVTFVTLKWLLKIVWRSRLCTCIPVCVSWRG